MQVDERLRPPWSPWEAVPVAVVAAAATFISGIAITAALGSQGGIATILFVIAMQAAFVTITTVWVAARYRGALPALGLRSRRPSHDLAFGAWTGAGLYGVIGFLVAPVVVAGWELLTGSPPGPIDQQLIPADPRPAELVLGLVAATIAAPIGEEVFFRGFLFGGLRARLGFPRAAAISAVVFAVVHVDPFLIVLMVFVGFGLALLYERRGSLVAPMAAHAMFNVIGYTLLVMDRV